LRFVGHFRSLQRSRQFLGLFGHFGLAIIGGLVLVLYGGQIFFEDAHGLIERIVVFLGIIDDLEQGLDDPRHLVELLLRQFPLLVEVLHRLCAVLHVHSDQVLLVAHRCSLLYNLLFI
jgi:hypothetical protein